MDKYLATILVDEDILNELKRYDQMRCNIKEMKIVDGVPTMDDIVKDFKRIFDHLFNETIKEDTCDS